MPIWQVLFLVNKWDRIMIGKKQWWLAGRLHLTVIISWVWPPQDAGSWYMKGCLGWDSHLPIFFHSDGSMACFATTGHEWPGLIISADLELQRTSVFKWMEMVTLRDKA